MKRIFTKLGLMLTMMALAIPALRAEDEMLDIVPGMFDTIDLEEGEPAIVTVTFSEWTSVRAEVRIGMAMVFNLNCAPSEDNTVWTITVPYDVVVECVKGYDELRLTIYADDRSGNRVYFMDLPYIGMEYYVNINVAKGMDFIVPIEGTTVKAPVNSFTVSGGELVIAPNDYNMVIPDEYDGPFNAFQSITVFNGDGDVVANAKPEEFYFNDSGEYVPVPFDGTVYLTAPITKPGKYTIFFPYRAFTLGENQMQEDGTGEEDTTIDYSIEKTVEFTVSSDESGMTTITSPGADAPVYNLQGVKVAADLNSLPEGIYIVNGKKIIKK